MTASSGDHGGSAPPTSLSAAVTLRVAEARIEDIGHAIARLAPDDLARIGARPGDIVKITGRTVAVARAELSAEGTEGLIQIDGTCAATAARGCRSRCR